MVVLGVHGVLMGWAVHSVNDALSIEADARHRDEMPALAKPAGAKALMPKAFSERAVWRTPQPLDASPEGARRAALRRLRPMHAFDEIGMGLRSSLACHRQLPNCRCSDLFTRLLCDGVYED